MRSSKEPPFEAILCKSGRGEDREKKKAEKQHTEERKTGKGGIMEVQMNKIFTKERRNNWI